MALETEETTAPSAATLRREDQEQRRANLATMTDQQVDKALSAALAGLLDRGASARPFNRRVEAACNEETGEVIELYGRLMGSTSEAIRALVARGAVSLAAERAASTATAKA